MNDFKEKREKKGYTLYRLSKMTGIAIQHLKKIEEGVGNPTIKTIKRINDALQ